MPLPQTADNDAVALQHVDFLVLVVLSDGPLHGYGVVQSIDQATQGRVRLRPGDVYRVLYRMQRRGLLDPVEPPRTDEADSDRRSYYAISELGSRVVRDEAELLAKFATQLLAQAGSTGAG